MSTRTTATSTTTSTRPRTSPEDYFFRLQVLRQYRCPFRDEVAGCRREQRPNSCSFAHSNTVQSGPMVSRGSAILIPPYICVYNLLNCCKLKVKPVVGPAGGTGSRGFHGTHGSNGSTGSRGSQGSSGSHGTNSDDDPLYACPSGLHLTTAQMIDLEQFESANCHLISHHLGPDGERECAICLDRVLSKRPARDRKFGLLRRCVHCFCGPCITQWAKQPQNGSSSGTMPCPICRVESDKVLVLSYFEQDPVKKARLFARFG